MPLAFTNSPAHSIQHTNSVCAACFVGGSDGQQDVNFKCNILTYFLIGCMITEGTPWTHARYFAGIRPMRGRLGIQDKIWHVPWLPISISFQPIPHPLLSACPPQTTPNHSQTAPAATSSGLVGDLGNSIPASGSVTFNCGALYML